MKKKCLVIFYIFLILSFIILSFSSVYNFSASAQVGAESDFLRLHIRGNSNSQIDQETKYAVRDAILPIIMEATQYCQSVEEASTAVLEISNEIIQVASEVSGMQATLEISLEEFPTREYEGELLLAGVYQSIIINLGDGVGDNWWCVAFPPLCFIDGEEIEGEEIVLKSKIAEIWDKYF